MYNETLTIHMAKETMTLKDANSCLSFVSMVWREKPIMVVFDNLNKHIINSFFDPTYQDGDIETLEELLNNFLN